MQKFISSLVKPVSTISTVILFAATALVPLIILPIGDNFLIDSKMGFIFGLAFIIGLLWTIITLARRSLQVTLSPFVVPLALIGVSTIVSIIFNQTTLHAPTPCLSR
jgi:hypothetical protein